MAQLKCKREYSLSPSSHSFDNNEDKLIRTLTIEGCVVRNITFNQEADKLFCGCEDGLVFLITLEGIPHLS